MNEISNEIQPNSISTPSISTSIELNENNQSDLPINIVIPSVESLPIINLKNEYKNDINSVKKVYNDYMRSLDTIESLKIELQNSVDHLQSLISQLDQKKIKLRIEYENTIQKLTK